MLMNDTKKRKELTQAMILRTSLEIIGDITIPRIRDCAKHLLKSSEGIDYLDSVLVANKQISYFAEHCNSKSGLKANMLYYEDVVLCAFLINSATMPIDLRLRYCSLFIPFIESWSVCDSFCCGAKWVKKNKQELWLFLEEYLTSFKEFEIRFGVIMLMCYFLEPEYISKVFKLIDAIDLRLNGINNRLYYVDMAIAWLVATAAAKLPEQTKNYWHSSALNEQILKKAAQKMRDSRRVNFNEYL